MVFRFPSSGIEIGNVGHGDHKMLSVATKDSVSAFSHEDWMESQRAAPFGMYTEPIQQTLSLLLVNKKIFTEAFSHFYRENVFHFWSIYSLCNVLRGLPRYRRQHLTQIAFGLEMFSSTHNRGSFHYLASLPNLRKLYIISTHVGTWEHGVHSYRSTMRP